MRTALLVLVTTAITLTATQAQTCDTNTAPRIMPLGNSITEAGNGWASYRCWMWKELSDSGCCFNLVGSRTGVWTQPPRGQGPSACPYVEFDENHEGHYGWEANELLYGSTNTMFGYTGKLSVWLPAASGRPDIVLLEIGTNDIDRGHGATSTRNEIGWIVDTLRAHNPNVTVLVAQITPAASALPGIDTLNGLLPALGSSKNTAQSRVILVDQHTGFNTSTDMRDNFHPNEQGERKIAHNWAVALLPILRSTAVARTNPPTAARAMRQHPAAVYTLTGRRIPGGAPARGLAVEATGLRVRVVARP
jgi:hypothetical protein